jgi:hypothetical protein
MNLFLGCLLALAVIAINELNARACSFSCSSILLPADGVVPANIPAISLGCGSVTDGPMRWGHG